MGYFDKLEDDSLAIRRLAAIVMAVNGSKSKIDQVWPLKDSDVKTEFEAPTKEWWDNVRKIHGYKGKDK